MPIGSYEAPSGTASAKDNTPLIAHVIHGLQAGGMENGVINLVNSLSPNRYRHAIVSVTYSTDFAQRIRAKNVSIHSLHKHPGKDPGFYLRFWRLMRKLKPAIIHTRNLGTLDLAPVAAAAGVPYRVHGEHGWDVSDTSGNSGKYRFLRKCCDPAVTRYIAVSKDIEEWLCGFIGISRSKIEQVYNGVDARIFRPDGPRAKLPFRNGGNSQIVIGTVGRMDPIKGVNVLISAIAKLVQSNPALRKRLRLVIVGDGPLLSATMDQVRLAKIDELIWFAGHRDDIPDMLRSLDLFVLASINEGISNSILESMATGLPVVVTNVGGNRELVCDGKTGRLVPVNDADQMGAAILRYFEDETLRRNHGRAARQRAEELYDLTSMVARYAKLYDRLLFGNNRQMADNK